MRHRPVYVCCEAAQPTPHATRHASPRSPTLPYPPSAAAAARVKLLVAREPFADFGVALGRALADDGDRTVVLTMPPQ